MTQAVLVTLQVGIKDGVAANAYDVPPENVAQTLAILQQIVAFNRGETSHIAMATAGKAVNPSDQAIAAEVARVESTKKAAGTKKADAKKDDKKADTKKPEDDLDALMGGTAQKDGDDMAAMLENNTGAQGENSGGDDAAILDLLGGDDANTDDDINSLLAGTDTDTGKVDPYEKMSRDEAFEELKERVKRHGGLWARGHLDKLQAVHKGIKLPELNKDQILVFLRDSDTQAK